MSYQRKKEDKRRLKKLYEESRWGYGRGAWYDEDKDRIIRYSNVSEGWYWKRFSNKQVRKTTAPIASGNAYRKIFDYWYQQF